MTEQRYRWLEQLGRDRWDGFLKGIEKEGLRVDRSGFIAQTPHPHALGSTLTHPSITTDYSESLLELITPVCNSTSSLLASLEEIHAFTQQKLGDEVMWAPSMPCRLAGDASIPIAEYGSSSIGRLKHVYRQGLGVRYGRIMQSIAGVHYNFSLPDSFWEPWQALQGDVQTLSDFKSREYFWLIRNFRRRSWLLMYLFGASPALDGSFVADHSHRLASWDARTCFGPQATSLRMGDLGYHNNAQGSLDICFNRLDNYTRTLDRAIHTPWPAYAALGTERDGQPIQINTNILQIENEYYSPIRPKRTTRPGEKPLAALRSRGVEYIEVRCLDLNPFLAIGLDADQIDFLDVFLLACLVDDSPMVDGPECAETDGNFRQVVAEGRNPQLMLQRQHEHKSLQALAAGLFESLYEAAAFLDGLSDSGHYQAVVNRLQGRLEAPEASLSAQVLAAMRVADAGHVDWGLAMSRQHQQDLRARSLSADRQQQLEDAVSQSLAATAELEAQSHESFPDYLQRYLSS